MRDTLLLLVEDSAVDRRIIVRHLLDLGYPHPLEAASGEEALELASGGAPALALMDIDLPGAMDGVETAAKLKEAWDIPAVFVTALTDPSVIARACQVNPVGYLVKPLNKLSLDGSIRVGLEQHRLVKELREALAQVKLLSGLLPICAHCKNIRNESGRWEQIESYIDKRSQASFTHGICPSCLDKFYPELK